MSDIEIKRGYEVLPDNNVRFGIKVINNSNFLISDVEVLLDYTESLFEIEGNKVQKLGNIPPTVPRTAKFILQPLGCIHKETIGATVIYKDHEWKKHTLEMRPKEVHCVCPFLKEKAIKEAEFLNLSRAGFSAEQGVNFENIDVDCVVSFLTQTCRNRLYKVAEYKIENGKILYLASESIGEKAYYLLTAVVKEYEGLTQILLRASSDKSHGVNGFINEIMEELRHVADTVQSAREIGIIKKEQVINIIDSVVQRTTFAGGEGGASVTIKDSVVQRTEIKGDEEKKRREEARIKKETEEQERLHRQKEEDKERLGRKEEQKAQEEVKTTSHIKLFAVAFVLVAVMLGVGLLTFLPKENNGSIPQEPTPTVTSVKPTPTVTSTEPAPTATSISASPQDQKTMNNSIGMEFVLIPAGGFDMGSPSNELGRKDWEGPLHYVEIKKDFYIGKYEVTQKQWRDVMGSNPSTFKGDDMPVEQVSWDDVHEFIKRLNAKEGTGKYRLPTEAEWEYAARAGTTTKYSFGDNESKLGDYAWYKENSEGKPHPVGQRKPNQWGLYDISGNVWEWVEDRWHDNYNDAPLDGRAWVSGNVANRVGRGGSWYSDAELCRSGFRTYASPGDRSGDLGFRLAKDV